MGYSRRGECTAHVGGRYGFPYSTRYYRCLTKAGGARYFRLYKSTRSYYDAVVRWFDDRHRWQVDSRWIIYTSGVVPALSAIIKALAMPGDKVIVQTPAYNCFYSSIRNDGCELFANNLVYQDGRYVIDFADLERKASDPKAKILLLCNPHNPVGRVWTPEELQHIGDICLRNEVFVVADEIHCELTYEGYDYTPLPPCPNAFCKIPSLAFRRVRRSTLPGCKSPISSQPMKRCAAVLTEPLTSTRYATSIRSA